MFCPRPNQVLSFEKYSKEIKLYSSDLKLKERHKLHLKKEGFILGVCFAEATHTYGVAASDEQLHFYMYT